MSPILLILGRPSILGWPSGSSIDSQDTLSFSNLTGVRPMTEVFPLERAAEAYDRMMAGKARFSRGSHHRTLIELRKAHRP
jgi:D-arabinose 1-dehydrogenase-like Zn-dependent alcohol dehydrogenase